jgi:hypothetical protein
VTTLAVTGGQPGANVYALTFAFLALWAICYVIACAIWPFTACRHCAGAGHHPSPRRRSWRYCRHCRGTGARLRTGRRIYNLLRDLRPDRW